LHLSITNTFGLELRVLKIGIVSDIHCNVAGLEEALRLMGDVDELICLGDSVMHNKFSNGVIGLLKDRGALMVLGNHDVDYLTGVAHRPSQRGIADDSLVEWLRSQPERLELEVAGKTLLAVHATPWSRDYIYPASPAFKRFAEVEADFVLGGHTHTPVARRMGRALVINPGSAGYADNRSGAAMLSCAVLDAVTDEVALIDYADIPLIG
jgi:putative phosphoesterase